MPLTRRRVVQLALAAVVTVIGAMLVLATKAYRNAQSDFHPPRAVPVRWPGEVPDLPGRMEAAFTSDQGDPILGWYSPPTNGASIVLLHGVRADRRQLAPEAAALASAGFGVLLYDGPGCGESGGNVRWGEAERGALRSALTWLSGRDGASRLGVLGLSQGAYTAVQVAAGDRRIQAMALEGAVSNYPDQTRHDFGKWGPVSKWPALLSRERIGFRPGDPQPDEVIASFDRPLLLIWGDQDQVTTWSHTERLLQRTRGPKEVWIVPGAHHGDYAHVAPDALRSRLIDFFSRSLRSDARPASSR